MEHWPWWLSGLGLGGVALAHWLLLQRQLAVSGRYTGIVNRLRHGPEDRSIEQVSQADLIAALQAATSLEFGAVDDGSELSSSVRQSKPLPLVEEKPPALVRRRASVLDHLAFLLALVAGGTLAVLTSGNSHAMTTLETAFAGRTWLVGVVLGLGGVFVGFGTRMAGGCTSGHGLCGVSRFQKGSLLATAMFFGSGVATALFLQVLL